MCGIAGILARGWDPQDVESAVNRMTDALSHRGPDDSGVQLLQLPGGLSLGLGHRRLSILDLSQHGHQPMADSAGESWIVYNGEIYNHRELRSGLGEAPFRSTSDTETLLRGWMEKGPEWIHKLRGIFAFALYDGRRGELWLARDPLGVKPLYVANPQPNLWLFASEVRAILASGLVSRTLCPEGLWGYLGFGAVQAPYTMLQGIRSLLPAERWRFRVDGSNGPLAPKADRYWAPQFPPADSGREVGPSLRDPDQGLDGGRLEHLREVWEDAVRSQMLSDVPVGVFLSGGIDSSAIVATLARLGYPTRTFSIAFRESAFDESSHARTVARACNTEHAEIVVSPSDVLDRFDSILAAYDQPSIDGVNIHTISKAVRETGIKVAISGLGADEVFGGYATFARFRRLDLWSRWSTEGMRRAVAAAMRPFVADTGRGGKLLELIRDARSRVAAYCVLRRIYPIGLRRQLTGIATGANPALEASLADDLACRTADIDAVNAASLLELSLYMHNMLLRDTDQMSMAHALEVRVPLLDPFLVDELARLPGGWKLPRRGQPNKWLLVELAGPLLPREVVERPKMGFVFPWSEWLRGPLRGQVDEVLMESGSVRRAGLAPQTVAALWRRFLEGDRRLRSSDILALVHLVRWASTNGVVAEATAVAALPE